MSELPSGTVTFLFTDIEGSTQLRATARRASTARFSAEHETHRPSGNRGPRRSRGGYAGRLVLLRFPAREGRRGDGGRCAAGARCARVAGRRSGRGSAWGISTGEASARGRPVCRHGRPQARRGSAAAGHGGQVLLSRTTRERRRGRAADAASTIRDLGERRLKDVAVRPERLSQLVIRGPAQRVRAS